MAVPDIKTPLPGPKAAALIARDAAVISPSYTRGYPLVMARDRGCAVTPGDADPPQPGDVICWWRGSPGGWQGHVGLVHSYADGIVRTVEGNKTPKVGTFTYTLASIDRLLGFARVP